MAASGLPSALDAARMGQALHASRNFREAIEWYRRGLRGGVRTPGLFFNLGSLLLRLGRRKSAAPILNEGLDRFPGDQRLLGEYLVSLLESPRGSGADHALEHFRYVGRAYPGNVPRPPFRTHRRLRIAWLSAEFREHPNAFLQYPHFRHFDRSRFELYFFSTGDVDDAFTGEARTTADHWREAAGLTNDQIAAMIRQDEIDILVDVTGHFVYSPLPVFALRPAPLQVSLCGYPATTGLPQVDFKIVDHVTDPSPVNDTWYTEKLHRLRRPFACYAPARTAPPVAEAPILRNGFITFGCFSRRSKITQPMLSLWAEILTQTPRSRLLFHHSFARQADIPSAIREPITRFFRGRGISSDRLEFQGHLPLEEHLACLTSVDIALDTFPYAGATITFDCLWMGVPVVTLAGDSHVSRTGASILSSLELCDWIANSPRRYVEIAAHHATDAQRLSMTRERLRPALEMSPLTDGIDYVRALEKSFLEMWRAVGGTVQS